MKKTLFKKALAAFSVLAMLSMAGCSDSDDDDNKTPDTEQGGGDNNGGNTGDGGNGGNTGNNDPITLDASKASFDLEAGKTYNITLTDISLAASKTFNLTGATWKIDDPYIAALHTNKIEPLSGGTAKLTSGETVVNITIAEPNREVTTDPFDLKTISENIDIFCCGDSIMRDYAASDSDQYGLGQALKVYFDETKANVVTDISNGGRSSRLFYNEASRWPEVKKRIEENNAAGKKSVVILSFGHNDQRALTDVNKDYGAQFTFASKNKNGTVAGTHYDFMEKYIVEARELGAVPVCLTPFARASFSSNGEVSADGKHDWTNKTMTGDDTPRGNYPAAMKAAAEKQGAILIDMTELSAARTKVYNDAGKIKYFYVDSDNTHERTLGGLELGKIVTDELKKNGYLTSYIKETQPRVMINKANIAFGRLLANASKTASFKVSSFMNKSGKISMAVPTGYGLSLDKDGTFASTLEIDTDENFIGTEVFVKFTPTEITSYNGDLTVTHSSVTPDFGNTIAGTVEGSTLKIALSGAGKEKSLTGTDATITWKMATSTGALDKTPSSTSEDITPAEVKLVGLVASTAKALNGVNYARVTIDNTGNVWPVNDTGAKDPNVYLEYAIPASGVDFTVNKISFDCCASGGSYMAWSAYYSTNADFSNPDEICGTTTAEKEVLKNNFVGGAKGSDEALGLPVEDGQTLYIRIYPAYKDTKENAGRTFIISNVTVEGLVQ